MNPQQCGYYPNQGMSRNYGGGSNRNQAGYPPQGYGNGASPRPGISSAYSRSPMQPTRTSSTYGFGGAQGSNRARAAPVFPISNSSSNMYRCAAQSQQCNRNTYRQPQPKPIPVCGSGNNYKMAYQQPQQCSNQHPLAPAPFCTPQAIKINVTAEQLENAKNSPYQGRGEPGVEDNPGAKYIQLNWQDLLGGMDNLRVSMVPSADPCNQNQQLKVSFGGQKTDPPQAGETCLKVLSIEPASSGRMDIQKGNALAGSMKICNSPVTNISPTPTTCPPRRGPYGGGNGFQGRPRQ